MDGRPQLFINGKPIKGIVSFFANTSAGVIGFRRAQEGPVGSDNMRIDWNDDLLFARMRSLSPSPEDLEGEG